MPWPVDGGKSASRSGCSPLFPRDSFYSDTERSRSTLYKALVDRSRCRVFKNKCNPEDTKVHEDHEENRRFSSLCLRGPGSRYRPCCRACRNATTKTRSSTKNTKKTIAVLLRGASGSSCPCGPGRVVA